MATRGEYFPVDYEDRSNSRLLEDSNPVDSLTESTTRAGNNNQDTRETKCMSLWIFSLIIIGLSVMFLVGICVGFYVRDLQTTGGPTMEEICSAQNKKQMTDYDKLGGKHETLVYYIRGEEIRKFVSEHGTEDPVTGSEAEKRLADAVLADLETYRTDTIEVEEYDVMVTNADPNRPNQLEVLDQNGMQLQLMVLTNNSKNPGNSSWLPDSSFQKWRHPHVLFSPAGQVQADLVYGHYGRDTDFVMIKSLGVEVKGRIILLRLGKLSVAEKIQNCESYGVRGVILYWEPEDAKDDATIPSDASYIPFTSAATYSAEETLWRPSIPCQTISSDQAKVIISMLRLVNNSIPASISWQGSLASTYVLGVRDSGSLVVRLSVFNKMSKQRIQNFISTIQGTDEPDRYVIVGAPRSSLPGQSQDVVASSSILTQLAHSFQYLHNQHYWKPRRTVKLISWGGAEFSNSGILHHIKSFHDVMDKRAIAYIDLRQLVLGNGTLVATVAPGLLQLLEETTLDVPDPTNGEQTLHMSWRLFIEENKNFSQQGLITFESYHGDRTQNPFLHVVGIPEVKVQYRASRGIQNSVAAMTTLDLNHHYKYHMTVTHILVRSLLTMLDNDVLPLSLPKEIRALQSTMWETSDVLEGCFPDINFYPTVELCSDLLKTAEGLREAANLFVKRNDKIMLRVLNDIIMSFQQSFLVNKNGTFHHLLSPTPYGGSLARAADLCEAASTNEVLNMAREFQESFNIALKRAQAWFRLSA